MIAVTGILIVVAIIIAIDARPLWRKKQKKELWTFSILMVFGTSLCIIYALGVNLPNPLDWLTAFFKPLSDMMNSF
ncbi:hypothetical protein [Cytobacillus firmus]|uniref:hypothetical protein n=1 Tax=Cytobacillus firmus TaxID=1399 RepID=UPI001C8D3686|nr:hypothetical protein [Cytobacillus firmus]MBX9975153.1 hypothetical protein [Cytobacillus firmus]